MANFSKLAVLFCAIVKDGGICYNILGICWRLSLFAAALGEESEEFAMASVLTGPGFAELAGEILAEFRSRGTVLGVQPHAVESQASGRFLGTHVANLVGVAASPHMRLATGIVAAYAAGGRVFELKTAQPQTEESLPLSCMLLPHESRQVAHGQDLPLAQALQEYIKAYLLIEVLSQELGFAGCGRSFHFSMGVGGRLHHLQTEEMHRFISTLLQAEESDIWQQSMSWLHDNLHLFSRVDEQFLAGLQPRICTSATLFADYGCTAAEMEEMVCWLMQEYSLPVQLKLHPTVLGLERAQQVLDEQGFDDLTLDAAAFAVDPALEELTAMLRRLHKFAAEQSIGFGIKLATPLPLLQKAASGDRLLLSGRAVYPLVVSLAAELSAVFLGRISCSFSSGVDAHNAARLLKAGISPLTCGAALYRAEGLHYLSRMADIAAKAAPPPYLDTAALRQMAADARQDDYYCRRERVEPQSRARAPLFDCQIAACQSSCPLQQDNPAIAAALAAGDKQQAARLLLAANPLPHLTAELCPKMCRKTCFCRFSPEEADIDRLHALAAQAAAEVISEFVPPRNTLGKAAIVGGGVAGLAAAAFLQRAGWQATVFDRQAEFGGKVYSTIPAYKLKAESLQADVELVRALGAQLEKMYDVADVGKLRREYDAVILAIGTAKPLIPQLEAGRAQDAVSFLTQLKQGSLPEISGHVCVLGGGNTAIDTACSALQLPGVSSASIIYRRDRHNITTDAASLSRAEAQGVRFRPLLSAIAWQDGQLDCDIMRLGAADEQGRRLPEMSGEIISIPCDYLLSATGEQVFTSFYQALMISVDEQGLPVINECGETNRSNLYIIGDGARGPSNIPQVIADAKRAVSALTGCSFDLPPTQEEKQEENIEKAKNIGEGESKQADSDEFLRCRQCGGHCGLCVNVCPTRANRLLMINNKQQMIHFADLCNNCAACIHICPAQGRPHMDKFTVFGNRISFNDSRNEGIALLSNNHLLLRYQGRRSEYVWEDEQVPSVEGLLGEVMGVI